MTPCQEELLKQEEDEIHSYLDRMRGVLMALRYTDHCGKLEESGTKPTTATAFLGSKNMGSTEWESMSSVDPKPEMVENEVALFFFV